MEELTTTVIMWVIKISMVLGYLALMVVVAPNDVKEKETQRK